MATFSEALLRIYRELVKGRTTVRVVPAGAAKLDCVPIFLTGVFRSGTTLTRYVIDSHSRIACPPESNFIRALEPLLSDKDNREGLATMGYDEEHVLARVRDFVAYCFENYARSHHKPRWADKTPAYVEHLDFVDRLFPTAQHLMIYRHPLDVAHSISKGGGHTPHYLKPYVERHGDPRVAAAAYWGECTQKMVDFEAAHPDRCHRIIYEQMCRTPEPLLRGAFAFLREPWEAAVLEYWKFPHDRGFEDGRAGATTGFAVSEGNYLAWPAEIISRAASTAGPCLGALGYKVETAAAGVS